MRDVITYASRLLFVSCKFIFVPSLFLSTSYIIKEIELYKRKINKRPKRNCPCRLVGMPHGESSKHATYARTNHLRRIRKKARVGAPRPPGDSAHALASLR